jgi:hypothetical protein
MNPVPSSEIEMENLVFTARAVDDRNSVVNMHAMESMLQMSVVPAEDYLLPGFGSHTKTELLVLAKESIGNVLRETSVNVFSLTEDVRVLYDAFTQLPMIAFSDEANLGSLRRFVQRLGAHRVAFLKKFVMARFGVAEDLYEGMLPLYYVPRTAAQVEMAARIRRVVALGVQREWTRTASEIHDLVSDALTAARAVAEVPPVEAAAEPPVYQTPPTRAARRRTREEIEGSDDAEDLFSPVPRAPRRARVGARNAVEALLFAAGIPSDYGGTRVNIAGFLAEANQPRPAGARYQDVVREY